MKRIAMALVIGMAFAALVAAQSTGREQNAGSSFLSVADEGLVPAAIDQNPGLSSEGSSNGGSYFQAVSEDVGGTILATGVDKPEANQ